MGLAFWRNKTDTPDPRKPTRRPRADAGDDADPAAALRVRARRRLIGAAALLLAAVIIVPLLLDPAPKPVADNIPIDIPSEKQPFTPRISLPPVPDPGQTPLAPPPDVPEDKPAAKGETKSDAKPETKADAKAEPKADTKAARPAEPKAAPKTEPKTEHKADKTSEAKPAEPKARPVVESKPAESKPAPEPAKSKAPKIVLQAAALSTDAAAQDLSERLRKAGFAPFTEKVETPDGTRFRVRVGPYVTRDEAQRAQSRLRALGVSATIVSA